jgi:5-methyltetrahydropteroyltriglutamate--homocysteine methyltransferase
MLLPTTIVGSYPQPEWLIDRARLAGRFPPRVRARELWRVPPEFLREAQDDATLRHTTRKIKMSVPGPFTMAQQAQIEHYGGSRELAAMDYAVAVNEEIRDLFSAGADVVQIDEPYMQARPEEARAWGQKALNRALEGVGGVTAVHICFGYAAIIHSRPSGYSFLPELQNCTCNQVSVETAQSNLDCSVLSGLDGKTIMLGVIDLSSTEVESPAVVAARIRRALPFVKPKDIIVCTDCGMKYLPRELASGKMAAMVEGARIVRGELEQK